MSQTYSNPIQGNVLVADGCEVLGAVECIKACAEYE